MSTFSSILSSINGQPRSSQQPPNVQRPTSSAQQNGGTRSLATPHNAVAGVKRKSEEQEPDVRVKAARTEDNGAAPHSNVPAPQNRFQLSAKAATSQKPSAVPQRPLLNSRTSSSSHKSTVNPLSKPATGIGLIPPATPTNSVPQKRGFASIMERAKAAQEAAKAVGASSIKHKPVERMTKRERRKMIEEAKLREKAGKGKGHAARTQDLNGSATQATTSQERQGVTDKSTAKKVAVPLAYKGTMRKLGPGETKAKSQQVHGQDKYGGYASWSDLDDAEDEEEDYDSEGSSDMEIGFDDVEREEASTMRAARSEDQAAWQEEEKHRREKLERKRKLQELSKTAAARKKY